MLPVTTGQLCGGGGAPCLSAASPRFRYTATGFGLTDNTVDTVDGTASYNAFTPAVSTGMFDVVDPGANATETVSINSAEWALTPALGLMIVSHGNRSGQDEAELIRVTIH